MAKNKVIKTKTTKERLTRPVTDADWVCPAHGCPVILVHRCNKGADGQSQYGGSFYACPEYSECGYYINIERGIVPKTDSNGIALGRRRSR